ncbi:MAG: hypothetical protein IJ832_00020 [Bacteroidaceae bacterium]|jgi:hypothetical protein|nr:hypothetical protein [Bacteroidaceae bacterium]
MKKEYIAPVLMQYKTAPLMISVSKGGEPVTDPSLVESKKFWGTSVFDDEEEDDIDF